MTLQDSLENLNAERPFPHRSFGIISALGRSACALHARLVNEDLGTYAELDSVNATGDRQSVQDSTAHDTFQAAITDLPEVGYLASEEAADPVRLGSGRISVAIDPFDGSKAFKYGIPAGTIFGLFLDCEKAGDFNGRKLFAAGFFLYSLNVELVLCIEGRVHLLRGDDLTPIHELGDGDGFISVNLSNMQYWDAPWQTFFHGKLLATQRAEPHNCRWFGSLVTHAKTVILSGGLFAYPPDTRRGYGAGYLRLVYEALPISLIIESLGGASTSGTARILERDVATVHDKTPLVFGDPRLVRELGSLLDTYRGPGGRRG